MIDADPEGSSDHPFQGMARKLATIGLEVPVA